MIERIQYNQLNDFFLEMSKRDGNGVFFYRINGYNEQIEEFIKKYYELARMSGVVIEGKIPNPDDKNLAYYNEIMGMQFQMDVNFIEISLKKWIPRMKDLHRKTVADAMFDVLDNLEKQGKNENVLKNTYIKFMCWLYYKFERVVDRLGDDTVPKILYEGDIGNYEFLLIRVLSLAGCDVVLLQYNGDQNYAKIDADSVYSDVLQLPEMEAFPAGFNLRELRLEMKRKVDHERLYGTRPVIKNCTNAWIEGESLADFKITVSARGSEPDFYYNCYCRINGVEDKLTYANELYQFYREMKDNHRRIVVINNEISQPSVEEINHIKRSNYDKPDQMILDLQSNIKYAANIELERLLKKTFVDIMLQESAKEGITLNKLTARTVYLLCWLKRYQSELFSGWKMPEVSCFIHMGGCLNESEALFVRFLARLPVDVLILNPDLRRKCVVQDELLYEVNYSDSLVVSIYPQESTQIQIGTTAYHAEQELDSLVYQDSGVYRNRQYGKAMSITLQIMYEEIAILWNQEMKYRPNFSVVNDMVNIPVVFSKVCGVKDGDLSEYWLSIKRLLGTDTYLIKNVPLISPTEPNPLKAYATEFYRNGKLQRSKIKSHNSYRYSILREETQDYILDKLQLLIEQRQIKGTFENGTEYTIVATVLNMSKEIIQLIQKFDFTKRNPKVVYINATEENISLEDSILMAFLNLIGFDIVFFVPTGYQTIEKYFNKKILEEHQIGEYMYDLRVPDFDTLHKTKRLSWRDKLFKRGR